MNRALGHLCAGRLTGRTTTGRKATGRIGMNITGFLLHIYIYIRVCVNESLGPLGPLGYVHRMSG